MGYYKSQKDTSSTKGAKASRARSDKDGWTIVDIPLSKLDKESIAQMSYDTLEWEEIEGELVELGYNIKLQYSDKQNAYQVSITGVSAKCPNYKLTLLTFAPSLILGKLSIIFKLQLKPPTEPWLSEGENEPTWS